MDSINFDSFNNDDLVIRSRAGIAVYINANDDVVIRQDGGNDDDHVIVVHKGDVEALVEALLNVEG